MEKNKRLATDWIMEALKQSGINVVRVSDEKARQFVNIDEYAANAQFSYNLSSSLFVSNAAKALNGIRQDKATAGHWLNMLEKAGGIKKGEDQWTKLSAWLSGQAETVLSKREVQAYLQEHGIKIREEIFQDIDTMTGVNRELQQEMNRYMEEARDENLFQEPEEIYRYAFDCMCNNHGDSFDMAFGQDHGVLYINDSEEAYDFLGINAIPEIRLQHTSEDLDNRTEIALFCPDIEPWNEEDDVHFGRVDEGRCIAWIRFGDTLIREDYSDEEIKRMRESLPKADQWLSDKNGIVFRPPTENKEYPYAHIERVNGTYWIRNVEGMLFVDHNSLESAVKEFNRYTVPKERTTRVLVIDEVQSLRHQEGHKTGYRDETSYQEVASRYDKIRKEWDTLRDELTLKYGPDWQNMPLNNLEYEKKLKNEGFSVEEADRCVRCREEFFQTVNELNRLENLPPIAPFKKNWHELCMKRMLNYAAENGYESIAWTTGQQQAERYKMNREIRSIYVGNRMTPVQAAKYLFGDTNHAGIPVTIDLNHNIQVRLLVNEKGTIIDYQDSFELKEWKGLNLSNLLGDDLTHRVLNTKNERITDFQKICFGGEGMKNLYDNKIPRFMNRFGKRFNVETRPIILNLDYFQQTFHGFKMTPDMRRALRKALPMFMRDTQGKIYGWVMDDTIYLTRKGMNAETAIHEYTHLWANAMRLKDGKTWNHIKDLLRDTPIWNEVRRDPNYRQIRNNDDALANETLARVSGRENTAKLEQAIHQATEHDISIRTWKQVKEAMTKFWSWVGRHILDIRQARTLTDVTDRVLGDLLRGYNPVLAQKDTQQDNEVHKGLKR